MNSTKAKRLIEHLENLTGKKVKIDENEVTRQHKKQFYGVTADFEREAKRLVAFYERNEDQHPSLKPFLKRIKRAIVNIESAFKSTESYLDSDKAEELPIVEIQQPIEEIQEQLIDNEENN